MEYTPMKDLNKHRTCDRSADKKVVTIVRGDCKTIITANPDGTLNVEYEKIAAQNLITVRYIHQNALTAVWNL